MTTVHHHPAHPHIWLYAAAAVAAGLLALLITTVIASSSGSHATTPAPQGPAVVEYHGPFFREVCFAGRAGGGNVEFARAGCLGAR